ncbi:hypothetical protein AV530_009988 [Patagioenas fasciata monilis]|uniref:Uncharacterized protein n=1 Tax=Patagioenas fasciata monilis TaxID=372326 RepID=A0A1V4KB47_PATFA|nr:hypothetical protein AV530_009988 [Patagioenas fasciata monilis]
MSLRLPSPLLRPPSPPSSRERSGAERSSARPSRDRLRGAEERVPWRAAAVSAARRNNLWQIICCLFLLQLAE